MIHCGRLRSYEVKMILEEAINLRIPSKYWDE